ncbi:hypothetical protein [Azospirillum agricola]|uniref:hypothetical protein n=1 Tax=Azospirillum agricola TaxID=1720247 RepID=UPI000A0F0D8C|nr:hypothetical protein [Azospirillum agricola]SMH34596.1 hypothetical protein SAMN02982994_0790 [Azospirillum lipoferum]
MTTRSQQQEQMSQPGNARPDGATGTAQAGASDGFVGAACGAGAGAAMIWQPVTVRGDGRRSGQRGGQ